MNDDIDYKAKSLRYLDDDVRETGVYNGYDFRSAAHRDADEIASKYKNDEGKFLVLATGDCEVKHKQISSEKKKNMKKKVAAFVVAGVIAILGVVQAGDFINHPENYLTTHPEYKGKVTFSQMIERTPSNFGIGGK